VQLTSKYVLCLTNHSARLLQLSLVISVSINTYIISLGFGRHIDTIGAEDLKTINLNTIMVACFGIIATTTGKTSFAITLYRITANQWVRGFLIFVIITVSKAYACMPSPLVLNTFPDQRIHESDMDFRAREVYAFQARI
jgi:hypothetical protein